MREKKFGLTSVYERAKKGKMSVDRVLGRDRIACDCARCRLEKWQRPSVVVRHRLIYGLMEKAQVEGRSESALLDINIPGPSHRRATPSVMASAVSSGSHSRAHSEPPPSPAPLPPDRDDGHPTAGVVVLDQPENRLGASVRAYKAATCKLAAVLDPGPFSLWAQRPDFERLETPSTIVPETPNRLALIDDLSDIDGDPYWQPLRHRSVSPVSSFEEGPVPLYPVLPHLFSSPPSEDGSMESYHSMRSVGSEEDRQFYQGLFGDDNPADYPAPPPDEPDDMNLDEPGGIGPDEEGGGDEPSDDDDPDDHGPGEDNMELDDEPRPALDMEPGAEPNDPDAHLGAAFEHPHRLRNIYIRTWTDSVFGRATREQTARTLMSHQSSLLDAAEEGELSEALAGCLPTMAQTMRSLERRLGINVDELIKIFTMCRKCGKRYSEDEIENLPHPGCPRLRPDAEEPCGHPLWEEKILYGGVRKRSPYKSFPYFPLPIAIERILVRPGMRELVQKHLRDGGEAPPATEQTWMDSTPLDRKFSRVSEAWGWNSEPAKLRRERDEETGTYGDIPEGDAPVSLASLPFGLSLALNCDGFQTFGKKGHSNTAVYIILNNLPFHLRTLSENMILAMVMPGPKEPNAYEFDQMMEPLINDIIELERGRHMRVHNMDIGRCEEQLVYAHLSMALVDHMARIKVCGHAGTKSELNFCIYCKMKRSYISVPEGFKAENFPPRDPIDTLDDKYAWLRAPEIDKDAISDETGVRFTEFDRLPGWYAASNCPLDGMHLLHLGTTRSIVENILIRSGLMNHSRRGQEKPFDRANRFIQRTIFPSFCSRRVPKFEKLKSSGKAEQFRHLEVILYAVLFEAWRRGDSIPDGLTPRGGKNLKVYAHQRRQAAELCRMRRHVWDYEENDNDEDAPTPESCRSVRSRRLVMLNILRYCLALKLILRHNISREDISTAQRLFSRVAVVFARLNMCLTPSFHYLQHLEDCMLKFGSIYETWSFPFERANRVLININNNGHILGELEKTMVRGFLKRAGAYGLVHQLQTIPNPKRDDTKTIEMMLKVMRNGPEHELQRGMLDAILAGEANFRGLERIALASTSREVDWNDGNHRLFWDMVMDFCGEQLPGVVVYGYGAPPHGGVRLDPKGSTRCFPFVHHGGLRFGNDFQSRGYTSRYGFIEDMVPVLTRRIYRCTLELEDEDDDERQILCAVIQRFKNPERHPIFPWDHIREELQVASWAFEELEDPEVVSIDTLTGVFALSDIQMSYGRYWITFAMKPMEPEAFNG